MASKTEQKLADARDELTEKELFDDLLIKVSDQSMRIVQLENELAEYEDRPEAFERLRKLLRTERRIRKEGSRIISTIAEERDKLQVDVAERAAEIERLKAQQCAHAGLPHDEPCAMVRGLNAEAERMKNIIVALKEWAEECYLSPGNPLYLHTGMRGKIRGIIDGSEARDHG